jgi:hypothetical protein
MGLGWQCHLPNNWEQCTSGVNPKFFVCEIVATHKIESFSAIPVGERFKILVGKVTDFRKMSVNGLKILCHALVPSGSNMLALQC